MIGQWIQYLQSKKRNIGMYATTKLDMHHHQLLATRKHSPSFHRDETVNVERFRI